MITRAEYLDRYATEKTAVFREYYAQFVTPAVRERLLQTIGQKRILASTDEHFNDIPLANWDNLKLPGDSWQLVREAGKCGPTLSDQVCIFKEAARQLREQAAAS